MLRKVINTRPINNVGKQIGDGLWCMLAKATAHRDEHITVIDSKDEFYAYFTPEREGDGKTPAPIHGGFAMTHFSGDVELEERIKKDLAVTVRCIPTEGQGLPGQDEPGTCPFTGKPSAGRVVWAKSY